MFNSLRAFFGLKSAEVPTSPVITPPGPTYREILKDHHIMSVLDMRPTDRLKDVGLTDKMFLTTTLSVSVALVAALTKRVEDLEELIRGPVRRTEAAIADEAFWSRRPVIYNGHTVP